MKIPTQLKKLLASGLFLAAGAFFSTSHATTVLYT